MKALSLAGLLGLVLSGSAQAAVISYTDHASFMAAVPNATAEDFESYATGTVITNQLTGIAAVSTDGENASVSAQIGAIPDLPFPMTPSTSSGDRFLSSELSAPTFATAGLNFQFGAPQSAIGFYVIDGSSLGGFRIDLFSGGASVGGFSFPQQASAFSFIGLVSTVTFDRAEVDALNAGDSWGLDDLTTAAAAPVPAPGASMLMAMGLSAMALLRRTRR